MNRLNRNIRRNIQIIFILCWDISNITPNVRTKFHAHPFTIYHSQLSGYPLGYPDNLPNFIGSFGYYLECLYLSHVISIY